MTDECNRQPYLTHINHGKLLEITGVKGHTSGHCTHVKKLTLIPLVQRTLSEHTNNDRTSRITYPKFGNY